MKFLTDLDKRHLKEVRTLTFYARDARTRAEAADYLARARERLIQAEEEMVE